MDNMDSLCQEPRKRLRKSASGPFPGSCHRPQFWVGAGGTPAWTPTTHTIGNHSTTALLPATPGTGLVAVYRWGSDRRRGEAGWKPCPFPNRTHRSCERAASPADARTRKAELLPASSDLRGKHAQHRSFFQSSDAKRGRIPDCKIN